eukprot:TRINITY_DN13325_c0_g2_i1.p1 TRINITY_DN13325_c0_g2~~TRINITY_DN13325_c0_g2_i1.p1  ORF type:complete len:1231 (+),score=524.96 TRINITY_DN13325_c0_g2_i1:60-3695(+)
MAEGSSVWERGVGGTWLTAPSRPRVPPGQKESVSPPRPHSRAADAVSPPPPPLSALPFASAPRKPPQRRSVELESDTLELLSRVEASQAAAVSQSPSVRGESTPPRQRYASPRRTSPRRTSPPRAAPPPDDPYAAQKKELEVDRLRRAAGRAEERLAQARKEAARANEQTRLRTALCSEVNTRVQEAERMQREAELEAEALRGERDALALNCRHAAGDADAQRQCVSTLENQLVAARLESAAERDHRRKEEVAAAERATDLEREASQLASRLALSVSDHEELKSQAAAAAAQSAARVSALRAEVDDARSELERVRASEQRCRVTADMATSRIAELDAERARVSSERDELLQRAEGADSDVSALRRELQEANHRADDEKLRADSGEERSRRLAADLDTAQKQMDHQREHLQAAQERADASMAAAAAAAERARTADIRVREVEEAVVGLTQQLRRTEDALADEKDERERAAAQHREEVRRVDAELQQTVELLSSARAERAVTDGRRDALADELSSARNQIRRLTDDIACAEAAAERHRALQEQLVAEHHAERDAWQARLVSLQDELGQAEAAGQALQGELARLRVAFTDAEQSAQHSRASGKQAAERHARERADIVQSHEAAVSELRSQLSDAAAAADVSKSRADELERSLAEARARVQTLEEQRQRLSAKADEERLSAAAAQDKLTKAAARHSAETSAMQAECAEKERSLLAKLQAAESEAGRVAAERDAAASAHSGERAEWRAEREAAAAAAAALRQEGAEAGRQLREALSARDGVAAQRAQEKERLEAAVADLRERAEKAERGRQDAEEGSAAARLELSGVSSEVSHLKAVNERVAAALEAERAARQSDADDLRKQVSSAKAAAVSSEMAAADAQEQLSRLQDTLLSASSEAGLKEEAAVRLTAQLRTESDSLRSELAKARDALRESAAKAEAEKSEVAASLAGAQRTIAEQAESAEEQAGRVKLLEEQRQKLLADLDLVRGQVAELSASHARLQHARDGFDAEARRRREEADQAIVEAAALREQLSGSERGVLRLEERVRQMQQDRARWESEVLDRMRREGAAADETVESLASERALTRRLQEQLRVEELEAQRLRTSLSAAADEDEVRRLHARVSHLEAANRTLSEQVSVAGTPKRRSNQQAVAAELASGLCAAQEKMADLVDQIERLRLENAGLRSKVGEGASPGIAASVSPRRPCTPPSEPVASPG